MAATLTLRPSIELGIVPTHCKFVGGLVPDDKGRLPRNPDGKIVILAEMQSIVAASPVKIAGAQISAFPGVDEGDKVELFKGLRELGLIVHIVMMVGGADPMNPADEDKVVAMLVDGLQTAVKHNIEHVGSTSIEEWMKPGATPKTGAEFAAAVAQNVKVHVRAVKESGITPDQIKKWHIEFLRGGEFQTFTNARKCWEFVKAANEALGRSLFKVLVDAAHCGDSDLSIPENIAVIKEIAAAGGLGMFHCSAKTTRGCLTTDDGWVGALLTACAQTGKLEQVYVELFHHEDPALEGLRKLDPGHGIDTTDGRTYTQTVIENTMEVARRLNNLAARGVL